MDQDTYNSIASKQNSIWEKNVVMLRKAIQHIDDKDETLWKNEIMPLLPGKRPTPDTGETIVGLEAVLKVRKEISGYKKLKSPYDAFWQLEHDLFSRTHEYEEAHRCDDKEKPLGYADDGFSYSDGIMQMVSETPKDVSCPIGVYDSALTTGWYINGVDHFYTNLIWLVVSGKEGRDAFNKANTPGLLFTFADILGSCKVLRFFLNDPYEDMLNSAAKEAKKATKSNKA